MGYAISVDDQHATVEICFSASVPHSEHVKARDELLAACRARNIHKVLVDVRALVGASPSTADLFDFGASWAALARQTPLLLAGVVPREIATRTWWQFGEDVAANRGFVTEVFDDIDRAREWLRSV